MRVSLALAFIYIFTIAISSVGGTIVAYVPTDACASPPGCDFNSSIWNITGVPSENDDVIITSDVEITIYSNSSEIVLHSLSFGTGNSVGVNFVLYNSVLNVTATNHPMKWGNENTTSSLALYLSTWSASAVYYGSQLFAENSVLDVHSVALIENATIVNSTCTGSHWSISDSTFLSSSVFLDKLDVNSINSHGSTLDLSSNLAVFVIGNITNGQLTVGNYLFVEGSLVFIQDTPTFILQLYTGSQPNASVSFTSPNSNSTLTLGGSIILSQYCTQCRNQDNGELFLGDGVTANFIGGAVCYITVGKNVTLNFSGSRGFNTGSCNIRQVSSATPTIINIEPLATTYLRTRQTIFADVIVSENGNLVVRDSSLLTNGSIYGGGSMDVHSGFVTCDELSIPEVNFHVDSFVTATSSITSSTISIVSGPTHISAPEINVENFVANTSHAFINGDYFQTGGTIEFYLENATTPLLPVNGSIELDSVSLYVNLENEFTEDKLALLQSLTKGVSANSISFRQSAALDSGFHLGSSEEEIYLERTAMLKFLRDHWFYFAGGVVFVIVGGAIIRRWRRRVRNFQYSRLNVN